MTTPEAQGVARERVLISPTPFNTLLWRVPVLRGDAHHEAFFSLLDPIVDPLPPIAPNAFRVMAARTNGLRGSRMRT